MRIGRAGEAVLTRLLRRAGDDNLRKVLMLWLLELGRRPPREGLRTMLQLEEDIDGQIDKLAIAYDGGVHAKHRLTRYHDFFVERVSEADVVLDVGCGKGELAYDIAERAGAHVIAVDTNESYLAFARSRFSHPRVEYVAADVTTFRPDRAVDVALLSNVLEHIEHRVELLRALRSTADVHRFLIRVPMRNRDWRVPLRGEVGLDELGPGHFVEYDEPGFRAELTEAGLEVVEARVNWGELWAEARPRA